MTKGIALDILRNWTCEECTFDYSGGCKNCERGQALDVAIAALEENAQLRAENARLKKDIEVDGDLISRATVIRLTKEMISAEEYGLMDLLDEVKKLPTIPQTDTKWDKLYMYLNDRRLAYSESVEEHIEDYYKGIYDDLGQIMSVMEDIEKEEPKSIPQTDSVMRNATKEEQESVDNYIKSISVKMIPVTVLEDIKTEIENHFINANNRYLNDLEYGQNQGLGIAFDIIDKYIAERSSE